MRQANEGKKSGLNGRAETGSGSDGRRVDGGAGGAVEEPTEGAGTGLAIGSGYSRQRYRLNSSIGRRLFVACPDWFEDDGVYEGDIDPSSQDLPDLMIRLFNPADPEQTFLVEEVCLEEVE